jgi:nitrogen fixation protein FixH
VVRSLDEVGSWSDLFSTGYGQLVLIKVGLILVLAGLGALNRYRHVARMRSSTAPLRRVGRFELVVAVGAIAAAGTLASLVPPASVPAAAGRPAAIVKRSSDFATSVRATLEVDPGLPGPNSFALRLEDYDTGEPVEAETVSIRFQPLGRADVGETTLDLTAGDDGTYTASGPNLSTGGPWDLVAVVQRGADAVEVPFQVSTVCPTQTVEEQGEPIIHLFQSPSRGTTEGYLIPLGGTRFEVHFTFIDPSGKEARVGELSMSAFRPESGLERLEPIQLTKGHFLAEATLEQGDWRFDGVAEIGGAETASGCFEESL